MYRKVATAAVALGAASFASPVLAQNMCGERDDFLQHLNESYEESPSAMGLASNGSVIEVLSSEKGSWTILVTSPRGVSCVVAAGEAWESLPPQIAMNSKPET